MLFFIVIFFVIGLLSLLVSLNKGIDCSSILTEGILSFLDFVFDAHFLSLLLYRMGGVRLRSVHTCLYISVLKWDVFFFSEGTTPPRARCATRCRLNWSGTWSRLTTWPTPKFWMRWKTPITEKGWGGGRMLGGEESRYVQVDDSNAITANIDLHLRQAHN